MIVHPRCRVCQRIHGLPRCEPMTAAELAGAIVEQAQVQPPEDLLATGIANKPNKAGKYKDPEARRAYMREYMARKRAAR